MKTCQETAPEKLRIYPTTENSAREYNPELCYAAEDFALDGDKPTQDGEAMYIRADLVRAAMPCNMDELMDEDPDMYRLGVALGMTANARGNRRKDRVAGFASG